MTILNNKLARIICSTIVVFGILSGCAPVYQMVNCPSYVVCYVDLESIELAVEPSDPQCILLHARNDFSKTYSLHSTGAEKERYNQLCQKHKDVSYNQKRLIGSVLDIESVTYNDCDFTEITVTADKDFDESHPAGTNLSDIVRFMTWFPDRYIQSGYSNYYHYDTSDVSEAFDTLMRIYINKEFFDKKTEATCYPIDKTIKELTAEDLVLIGGDDALALLGMFYFDHKPQEEGDFIIKISIKTDNSKVLSDSVKLTF